VSVAHKLRGVRGLISTDQGERLAKLAAGVPAWASIVEIGSHTGLSTCYMGLAARAHVFAVDPWLPPRPGSNDDPFGLDGQVYEEFVQNLTKLNLWPKVTPLRGMSIDVAKLWTAPIGLLFIDSVHTEEDVRADYGAWSGHIIKGGWLAFHDYDNNPEHEYYGVSIVADELAASGEWDVQPQTDWSLWTARRR
jgi:hypothetical protein